MSRLSDMDERRIRSVILEWLNEADVEEAEALSKKIAANLRPTIDSGLTMHRSGHMTGREAAFDSWMSWLSRVSNEVAEFGASFKATEAIFEEAHCARILRAVGAAERNPKGKP